MAKMSTKTSRAQELVDDPYGQPDVSGESEEDLTQVNPASLSSAVVWGTDWTAATLVDQLRRKTIALDPEFQRRDAWTDERKSRFIESLVLGLPIPQLVLAESENTKGKFIVIDGKQRLLSLLKFTGVGLDPNQQPLVLKGLTILTDLDKKTYAGMRADIRYADLVLAFENQSIRTVVIRGWKDEEVLYTIFHRLNTGSLPLSSQELRQALHPGPFLSFAARFSEESQPLRKVLGLTRPDFRMRDVELVVRFYAFRLGLSGYRGNLKRFLDDTCDQLNREWETREHALRQIAVEFDRSIEASVKIFSLPHVFRKWDEVRFEQRLNRAVFDIVAHSMAVPALRLAALKKRVEVVKAFKTLCADDDFRATIEATTKSKKAVRTRFSEWYKALGKAIGKRVQVTLP
ncbi:MAG: DUF262 domain-containing protein [Armatimonadetes bacterium]|nr:DUF262 domain-containing protein [Armatimonadota bacterium]